MLEGVEKGRDGLGSIGSEKVGNEEWDEAGGGRARNSGIE